MVCLQPDFESLAETRQPGIKSNVLEVVKTHLVDDCGLRTVLLFVGGCKFADAVFEHGHPEQIIVRKCIVTVDFERVGEEEGTVVEAKCRYNRHLFRLNMQKFHKQAIHFATAACLDKGIFVVIVMSEHVVVYFHATVAIESC